MIQSVQSRNIKVQLRAYPSDMIGKRTTDERPNDGTHTKDGSERPKQPRSVFKSSHLGYDLYHRHEDTCSSDAGYSPASNELIDILAETTY